jgi:hypothetical protein
MVQNAPFEGVCPFVGNQPIGQIAIFSNLCAMQKFFQAICKERSEPSNRTNPTINAID